MWTLRWNDLDRYWEVLAPIGVIVRRFPTRLQAEDYLNVVLQDEGWQQ